MNVIQQLMGIQAVDDQISELLDKRKKINRGAEELEARIAVCEKELSGQAARLQETVQWHKNQETEFNDEAERLKGFKAKYGAVRNTKEFEASSREMEQSQKVLKTKEEELLKLGEAVELFRKTVAAQEANIQELRTSLSETRQSNQEALQKLAQDLKDLEAAKVKQGDALKPDIFRRYNQVLQRRQGKAVVPVLAGKCTGCNMQMLPQLYNQIIQEERIYNCPTCSRFLFAPVQPQSQA